MTQPLIDANNVFTYHAPHGDQVDRYQMIREEGRLMAETLLGACPDSPELRTALDRVREAVMWANASIACNEPGPAASD